MQQHLKISFFVSLIFVLGIGCSKEENEDPVNPNLNDYTPMSVGNYWVYAYYNIDSLGNEELTSIVDCVYISSIVNIDNEDFYQFEGTYYPTFVNRSILWQLRDSSGYLINSEGNILFSSDDFRDSLEVNIVTNGVGDILVSEVYRMKTVNGTISVPAGEFNALNFQGTILGVELKPRPGIENPRYWNAFYSKGKGKISETFFAFNQFGYSERRLVKFKIN